MWSKFEQCGDNGVNGVKMAGNWEWWTQGKKNEHGVQIWIYASKSMENGVRVGESGKMGKHGIVR